MCPHALSRVSSRKQLHVCPQGSAEAVTPKRKKGKRKRNDKEAGADVSSAGENNATPSKRKAGVATGVVHKATPKGKGARKRNRQHKPSRVKEIANKTLAHQESLRLRADNAHAGTAGFTPKKTKAKRQKKQKTPTVTQRRETPNRKTE